MTIGRIPSVEGGIQPTIFDAKADILTATAADTPARLAVGNNGETLVADSSTSTGLRYQAAIAAGRNVFINGNYDFWQRGTSTASVANGAFLADRWKTVLAGTGITATYSQDTSVPNGNSKFSAKLQQLGSSATVVSEFGFFQPLEGGSVLPLMGKTVTLSFYYRSNQTGTHYARVYASGLTGGTDITNTFSVSVADTWEKKSINFSSFAAATAMSVALTAEAAGLQIGIRTFGSGGTETIAANDYFQISQVQLEAGSVATAFQTATGTLQGELAACQRYYVRFNDPSNTRGNIGSAIRYSGTNGLALVYLPVTMRVAPTALESASLEVSDIEATNIAITAVTLASTYATNKTLGIDFTVASGLVANRPYFLRQANTTAGYLGVIAEL